MVSYYEEGPRVFADVMLDDWFKRTFEEYGDAKRLMQLFIEAMIPERKIVSLDYAPQESTNQNPGKKSIRVDVECYDDAGRRFVVEVQRAEQSSFYDRAVFNSTFAIQRQLRRGEKDYQFPQVYFIGIMRFSLHEGDARFLYRYALTEETTGEVMTDDLHYIFFEIPKCRGGKEASFLEKVGYALYNLRLMKERPSGFEGELFDLLFSSAEISKFTAEEKIKYENDMTTERDIQNQIAFARSKGIEQGVAQEKAAIAKAMLADGIAIDLIAKYSGLSVEEVKALS